MAAFSNGPVRVSSGTLAANLITRVDPVFPEQAIAAHVNGAVVMKAIVSKTGDVEDLTVLSGPDMLRAPYADAVRQWKYRPYLINGQPVEVETVITITVNMGAQPTNGEPATPPVYVSSGTMAGRVIYRPDPVFPRLDKDAKVQGAVVLHVIVSKTGEVASVNAITAPKDLVPYVIDFVKQWKYKPYLVDGQPVEVETTVAINILFGGGKDTPVVPKHIGGSVSAPILIYSVEPDLRSTGGMDGCCPLVNMWVDEQGIPSHVRVLKGCGEARDDLTVDAVKQYRFKPARESGKPVVVELNVDVCMSRL